VKKKETGNNIVYSTDKAFQFEQPEKQEVQLPPSQQKLKVKLETKNRGGKAVTVIEGFYGAGSEELGKTLKTICGTGGSVKDGVIIVQGDNRKKVNEWLIKNGYTQTT
jgi:translation initiation factor 1